MGKFVEYFALTVLVLGAAYLTVEPMVARTAESLMNSGHMILERGR